MGLAVAASDSAAAAEEREATNPELGSNWELDAAVDRAVRISFPLDSEGGESELELRGENAFLVVPPPTRNCDPHRYR